MKQGQRHILTLTWPEESGQRLSIVRAARMWGVFQRFTTDAPTSGYVSTELIRRVAFFVFRFQQVSLILAFLLSEW
jgi:hypothetical protein